MCVCVCVYVCVCVHLLPSASNGQVAAVEPDVTSTQVEVLTPLHSTSLPPTSCPPSFLWLLFKGFWAALNSLAPSAKRPIILTASTTPAWLDELKFAPTHDLRFHRPPASLLAQHGVAAVAAMGARKSLGQLHVDGGGTHVIIDSDSCPSSPHKAQSDRRMSCSPDIEVIAERHLGRTREALAAFGADVDASMLMHAFARVASVCDGDIRRFFLSLQLWCNGSIHPASVS